MKTTFISFVLLTATALALLTLAGCGHTMGVGDGPLTNLSSVRIKTNDPNLIQYETVAVFRENGFVHTSGGYGTMIFRKQGNASAEFVWGNLNNSNPVWVEPRVTVTSETNNTYFVSCNVALVQSRRSSGESEKKPFLSGKITYQSLLNQIKKRVEKASDLTQPEPI